LNRLDRPVLITPVKLPYLVAIRGETLFGFFIHSIGFQFLSNMDAQAKKKALFRAKLNAQKKEKRIESPLVRFFLFPSIQLYNS
jgi:hypothetical protein